ncbi:MAG: hypothetical protein FJ312_08240 [SAR202 cluster bacterium]|nr:hypothetical protein [SAR202 cluster bacterium]
MDTSNLATRPLDDYLAQRVPPSASSVAPLYRETAVCHAYMCVYAYGCSQKTQRPAQVMKRRCMRYLPEGMRVEPGLSDMALDVLARQRQQGHRLSSTVLVIMDKMRPNGPLRRS